MPLPQEIITAQSQSRIFALHLSAPGTAAITDNKPEPGQWPRG